MIPATRRMAFRGAIPVSLPFKTREVMGTVRYVQFGQRSAHITEHKQLGARQVLHQREAVVWLPVTLCINYDRVQYAYNKQCILFLKFFS